MNILLIVQKYYYLVLFSFKGCCQNITICTCSFNFNGGAWHKFTKMSHRII